MQWRNKAGNTTFYLLTKIANNFETLQRKRTRKRTIQGAYTFYGLESSSWTIMLTTFIAAITQFK